MADDDKDNESGVDPWADIESGSAPDLTEGFSFSFDEAAVETPAASIDEPVADIPEEPLLSAAAESPVHDAAAVDPDDDLVNSWLDDQADAAPVAAGPLGVFAPEDEPVEETVAGQSSIQIGTGESGTHSPSSIEALGFSVEEGQPAANASGDLGGFAAWETAGEDAAADGAAFPGTGNGSDTVGEEMFASGGESSESDETLSMFAGVGEDAAADAESAEAGEGADVIDFASAAATGTVAAAAAAAATKRPAKQQPRSKKSGGLGPMIGVVLGGAMAIPIVLGILIGLMWLGWKDTIGIRKMLPDQLAFLLPAKRAGGQAAGSMLPDLSNAPTLDDVAAAVTDVASAVATPPSDEPVPSTPSSSDEGTEPTGDEPPAVPGNEPDASATATVPAPSAPVEPSPPAAPADDPLAGLLDENPAAPAPKEMASTPAVDPLAGLLDVPQPSAPPTFEPPAPAPMPVPSPPQTPAVPPLDTVPLEKAVAAAAAALDALEDAVEPEENVREGLLVDWYKSLARVAEEFTALEAVAVESGRPLSHAPDQVVALHDGIVTRPARVADLTRLARNWLDYGHRGSEGIVVPATFNGARKVGPYWCAKVALAEQTEGARSLAVISRAEPVAAPGDLVVITGLTLDGDVVWAADIRTAKPAVDGAGDEAGLDGDRPPARPAQPVENDPLDNLLGDDEPAAPAAPAPAADASAESEPAAGGDEPAADSEPADEKEDPFGDNDPSPAEDPGSGNDSEP